MSRFNVMPRANPTCECGAPLTHLTTGTPNADRATFTALCENEHLTHGTLSHQEANELKQALEANAKDSR